MKITEKSRLEKPDARRESPAGTGRATTTQLVPEKEARGWTAKPVKRTAGLTAVHPLRAVSETVAEALEPRWPSLSLQDLRSRGTLKIAGEMEALDLHQNLGAASSVGDRFLLRERRTAAVEALHEAPRILSQMTRQILEPGTLTDGDLEATYVQHAAYANGELARALPGRINAQLSRLVLERYFAGDLQASRAPAGDLPSKGALLEANLNAALAHPEEDGPKLQAWMAQVAEHGLLDVDALHGESGTRANYPSVLAGRKTIEFAEWLTNRNVPAARALLKETFERPYGDIAQLARNGRGTQSLLARFAFVSFHHAWRVSKLATAEGLPDAQAEKILGHQDLVSFQSLMHANDGSHFAVSAGKNADQVLASIGRTGAIDLGTVQTSNGVSLRHNLNEIVERGVHDRDGNVTPAALGVSHWIGDAMRSALRVTDYRVAARQAQEVVADSAAGFAASAVSPGDSASRERMHTFFDALLVKFQPVLEKLHREGKLGPDVQAYKDLFQQFSGRFSLDTLNEQLGAATSQGLVRTAKVADLIPLAAKALQMNVPQGYSAKSLVRDIEELHRSLLADDYFLKPTEGEKESGTLAGLRREAGSPATASINAANLEMAVRAPNAAWMWLLLIRGLVENKPQRLKGGEADLASDKFPDHVQFNAPEVRDNMLFNWARERLSERRPPLSQKRIQEMALSLVVFTQYKDLLQLRKAANVQI